MPTIRAPLNSTALSSAEFATDDDNADMGTLEIYFTNGSNYTYENVPKFVFEALTKASSPGRYYLDNIKSVY